MRTDEKAIELGEVYLTQQACDAIPPSVLDEAIESHKTWSNPEPLCYAHGCQHRTPAQPVLHHSRHGCCQGTRLVWFDVMTISVGGPTVTIVHVSQLENGVFDDRSQGRTQTSALVRDQQPI